MLTVDAVKVLDGFDGTAPLTVTQDSTERCVVSIVSPTWETDDPTIAVRFGVEVSFDGGVTWTHWFSGLTHPGSHGRAGERPTVSIGLRPTIGKGQSYAVRGFARTTKALAVGLAIRHDPWTPQRAEVII